MGLSVHDGDLKVNGDLAATTLTVPPASIDESHLKAGAQLPRGKLALDSNKPFTVPPSDFRIWDKVSGDWFEPLPSTAAADDLALEGGTHGSASPIITAGDINNNGILDTRKARNPQLIVPYSYVDGKTLTLRFRAATQTNPADVSSKLDVKVFKSDGQGGVGSDICATLQTNINSTTWADYDFTITPTGLVAGDVLDVIIELEFHDNATGAEVKPTIGKVTLLADVRA